MSASWIQVTWDLDKKSDLVRVRDEGLRVDFPPDNSSIRGVEPLPSSGVVRWRMNVIENRHGAVYFGVCTDTYHRWNTNPGGEQGCWVWNAQPSRGWTFSEREKVGGSDSWALGPTGSTVDVVYDADASCVTFELDGNPLEDCEGLWPPKGAMIYPILGNFGGASVESKSPRDVALQLHAHMEAGSMIARCTALSGETLKELVGLSPTKTGQYLASRVAEEVPAPAGTQWKLVLPSGEVLDGERLLVPLRELFAVDRCREEQVANATRRREGEEAAAAIPAPEEDSDDGSCFQL